MIATILRNDSQEAWLQNRQKGIGGTDVSAILGVNKYKTAFDVWQDKTGRAPKFEGNKMTKRGQYMEDAVANYFEDATCHRVIKASDNDELLIHPTHPFLLGSPDRRYFDAEGGKGVLECKTTMNQIEEDIEAIPQTWFIQLQWYLGLTGYRRGTLAWAELGYSSDFKHVTIDFNKDFYEYLVDQAVIFWNTYMVTDTPPPAMTSEDVLKKYSSHADGKFIEVTEDLEHTYQDLKAMTEVYRNLEKQIEEKQEALKLAIGDAEGARFGAEILCTWKTSKASLKFDEKAFKAADPETWNKYSAEKPGSRRFNLK